MSGPPLGRVAAKSLYVATRPKPLKGKDEFVHHCVGMKWRGGKSQPFGPSRHGGIVDRLHVNSVLRQKRVRNQFAVNWIPDQNGHDMAYGRHHRQASALEAGTSAPTLFPGDGRERHCGS